MTREDLGSAIYAANDIGMQWYALTHQVAQPGIGTMTYRTNGDSSSVQLGSGALVVIGLAVVAVVLLARK